jgi:hypothetical protein
MTIALGWGSLRCGLTDEVIARTGPEAGPLEAGAFCNSNDDCVSSELFCSKGSCEAGTGTCEFRDSGACDPSDFTAKCGCSGILYFNDCVRQQHGESAVADPNVPNSCPAMPCDGTDAAACKDSYCALGPVDCLGPVDPRRRGFCWALPEKCPAFVSVMTTPSIPFLNSPTAEPLVHSCKTGQCVSLCDAIKAGPFSFTCGFDASAD